MTAVPSILQEKKAGWIGLKAAGGCRKDATAFAVCTLIIYFFYNFLILPSQLEAQNKYLAGLVGRFSLMKRVAEPIGPWLGDVEATAAGRQDSCEATFNSCSEWRYSWAGKGSVVTQNPRCTDQDCVFVRTNPMTALHSIYAPTADAIF